MGQEQHAKMFECQQNHNISEKIALGLVKPMLLKESILNSHLFNQESLLGLFADDEAYNLYDCPLFHSSTAAAAIYKAHGNITKGNPDSFGEGTEEGIDKALDNNRILIRPESDSRVPRTRRSEKDQCNSRRILAMFLAWTNS
ncbi:hypothetical protein WOLCODRAFT_158743 [Wolfiporia cocos MD-104 SS10]|uniref:Pre-mRNA-processing protein 45 n=1 Tax=Wolfiporia cocos (strain MD-104) TaxID=742152 RepID=A0A2H3JAB3_WOLCO|nr:hypothetical protein WOLCODRAFT_158743 [Wolfiporia cocos MD-104 SS10]